MRKNSDINILVAPLDWGLGHAARCVPLISQLIDHEYHVIIAGSGRSASFLSKEFPGIHTVWFPDYDVFCPRDSSLVYRLIWRLPSLFRRIRKEQQLLEKIIAQHKIQVVISDNRYGLWSKNTYSIMLTHQLMLKLPHGWKIMQGMVHRKILQMISRFDEVWIPDISGQRNLSGDLAHLYPIPPHARFVGWMSRFANDSSQNQEAPSFQYDILAVLSGPEPQRTHFQRMLEARLKEFKGCCCIIMGCPEQEENRTEGNITYLSFAGHDQLLDFMQVSRHIVCRPGYSTLMDLVCLRKKAILIPTPGQTEQEYLANHLKELGLFYSCSQRTFSPAEAIDKSGVYPGFSSGDRSESFFSLPAITWHKAIN